MEDDHCLLRYPKFTPRSFREGAEFSDLVPERNEREETERSGESYSTDAEAQVMVVLLPKRCFSFRRICG
jgi:hypothetical protein